MFNRFYLNKILNKVRCKCSNV